MKPAMTCHVFRLTWRRLSNRRTMDEIAIRTAPLILALDDYRLWDRFES